MNNHQPIERLPYATRMRNRVIVAVVFLCICLGIGNCIFTDDNKTVTANLSPKTETVPADSLATIRGESAKNEANLKTENAPEKFFQKHSAENLQNVKAEITAQVAPERPAETFIDSLHIKNQGNVFLAQKIDNLLRRFKPEHAIILMVDPRSNEILAWGENKNGIVQNEPDYLIRNTFPAASLAKTITIAAAFESKRYSLNSQIPMIGRSHTLYKNQLKVKENFKGPFIELQDAYAKSSNPPLAIIGQNVGASRLKNAAKKLGYNMNFPGGLPMRSSYNPPDTGYGLAEASCGFTEATTLTPLLAAAQVRAIITQNPLQIPWAKDLKNFAPSRPLALEVEKFNSDTYYGLKQSMIRSVTHGTARKNISTKHLARKNYAALNIGGKTGSLDGPDPHGRYEWFMGFAESKENPKNSIILVVMQVHDLQGMRSQPATQVAAMLINYWAHEYLNKGI